MPTPDPLRAVADAHAGVRDADARLERAVLEARAAGHSWSEVGAVLGVTRQAAFKRFGHPVDPESGRPVGTGPLVDPAALVEAVFIHIAAAEYAELHALMTAACARELSRTRISGVWREVLAGVGELEGFSGHAVRGSGGDELPLAPQAGPFVARVVLEHEAGECAGHVAVNRSGKVAGVLVGPLEHEAAMAF